MAVNLGRRGSLLAVTILVWANPICVIAHTGGGQGKPSLDWSIKPSKDTYYPGEPLLLRVMIGNIGGHKEKIDFGADGIEGFSIEIRDHLNKVMCVGNRIQRAGLTRRGFVEVPAGKVSQKPIVVNRWCSTLLPPGQYHVVCHVEYRLRSEATRIPGTEKGFKAGPLHTTQLQSGIELIKPDPSKYNKILHNVARYELKREGQSFTDWKEKRDLARKMIAFTEWESAVPYQLDLLKVVIYTWPKKDLINSLARSGTLEAATGLIQIVSENEDRPERIEDIKREIIDAVYRLRETGKSDIIKATDEFVLRYRRLL
jgi:hypothetical protein